MDIEIYQKANNGKVQEIRALRSMGAGFEWKDNEGKTALILACSRHDLFHIAKILVELGANIDSYRPGRNGGTPLHHATMKGHEETVKLLLANGANPFIRNDEGHTALDLARKKRHVAIVRAIESHISIFCGWLRAEFAVLTGNLRQISSDFRSGKIWVVVLPCDSNDSTLPRKFELGIYLSPEVAVPHEVVQLCECNIQPDFILTDPSLIIETNSGTRYKLFPDIRWRMTQLRMFYNACRGISEENDSSFISQSPPAPTRTIIPTRPHLTHSNAFASLRQRAIESYSANQEELDLEMAIKESIQTAISEGILSENSTGTYIYEPTSRHSTTSSEEFFYDAHSHNPFINLSPVNPSVSTSNNGENGKGICVICFDERIEAACIPCGHMAGCMKCLKKIEAKNKKCPVCRTNVDQVVKIYTV